MAWIVGDGFDYYGTVADVARSVWDSTVTAAVGLTTASRFGTGQALAKTAITVTPYVTKTLATNEATLFVALAFFRVGALAGTNAEAYVQFRDGATAQCTVVFESSGNLVLKSGSHTGTVLATYTGAFAQDVWTHFQIKVVISNTAGSMTVRKNGQPSDTYASAATLNTRGGTANNYANVIVLGNGFSGANFSVDDLLLYSGSGAAPNDWVGDVRALALPVAGAGASSQFAASTTAATLGELGAGSNIVFSPNVVHFFGSFAGTGALGPYWGRAGVVTKVTLNFASAATGTVRTAVYAMDAATGKPGALVGSSDAVTNPAAGMVDVPFTAGPTLQSSQRYFLAVLHNVAGSATLVSRSGGSVSIYQQSQPYASGFPASGVTAGINASSRDAFILATVTDAVVAVNELLGNADVDYVFDATVGHEDLYTVEDLPVVPAAILGVVAKAFLKKSDAGSRNGVVRLRSGATDVQSPDLPLSSSYTYVSRVDPVDPATGAPWTLAAVNALQVGQKVTA